MFSPQTCRLVVPTLALLALCSFPDVSWAQPKKKAPPPSTGAPVLNFQLPLGCQRGVAQEIVLAGTNLAPAAAFWTGFTAKVELVADDKLEAEGKVKVRITAPPETPLGLYPVRLVAEGGVSNFRLFAVDELPEVVDNDANHDKAKPQEIATPCVVAGRTDADVSDYQNNLAATDDPAEPSVCRPVP